VAILVTGATGLVGRLLVGELARQKAEVRAVSRRGRPAEELMDGVRAVFLHPRAVDDFEALLATADVHGVRKVVALSAMNVDDPDDEQPSRLAGDRNRECEAAAVASGLRWVSLRPSTFASNTARAFGPQVRAGDVVRYPYAEFRESVIDERDLAAVAAHALLTDDLDGRRVELTGPHDLSHAALVAMIGSVLGRDLRFEEVPPAATRAAMIGAGAPAAFVDGLLARYARHLDKPHLPANGNVAAILGRPAHTYAEWVAAHAGDFQSSEDAR
jgi:uncharacterized protein YbjT (DUF2867 family)